MTGIMMFVWILYGCPEGLLTADCDLGKYKQNDTCKTCPSQCSMCVSNVTCTMCKPGFYGDTCTQVYNESKEQNIEDINTTQSIIVFVIAILVISIAIRRKRCARRVSELISTIQDEYRRNHTGNKVKIVKCLVLDPNSTNATRLFLKYLEQRLEQYCIHMHTAETTEQSLDSDANVPVLLICNNVSRIGADVKNTVLRVSPTFLNRKIVLLVLHCLKASNLPMVSSKEKLQNNPDCKNFIGIVDVAFDWEEGSIYNCDMNLKAFETLQQLLRNPYQFQDKHEPSNVKYC